MPLGMTEGSAFEKVVPTPDAVPTLDATIGILSADRVRGDTINTWNIAADELPAVLAGIGVAEA